MSEHSPLVQRFLRYVAIDTQSEEGVEAYPSTEKQKNLSRLLLEEVKALGLSDADMDQYGYVMATIPSNVDHEVPTLGLIAHVDTSPEVSGEDVKPRLHEAYDGGPIELGHGFTLTPEQSPQLLKFKGCTLITSDGSTLLGADNKAGVAEIMTLAHTLMTDPSIKHGKIRLGFTCDEEVGRGVDFFDVEKFGADYAYTVDGETPGEIENETFCADSATLTVTGINVHPGYAKDKLVSAIKGACRFVELLPRHMTPETTEGRQGYIHPVAIQGGVEEAVVKLILRDFDEGPLKAQRRVLDDIRKVVEREYPGIKLELAYAESYQNMRFVLDQHKDVVDKALEAVRRAGLEPRLNLIRGGTDGSRLSFMGIPTPNIFTGGHLFHSRSEWIAVEGMESAVKTLVELVKLWAEPA